MHLEEGSFDIEPCDDLPHDKMKKFFGKHAVIIHESVSEIAAMTYPHTESKIYKVLTKLQSRGATRGKDFIIRQNVDRTMYYLHTTTRFISKHEDIL